MNYSNTDCLGNTLTYNAPVAFNASVRNNNCATFDATNNPSYIVLGDDNVLGDVSKVIFRYKGTYNQSNVFFGNIFPKITYGNYFGATDIDTLTLKYEGMRYIFTASVFDSKWHIIEVSIVNSTPELKIDNVIIPYTIVDNSLTILFTTIAARYTVQYQFPNTGSMCDFKCYDSNNTLTHWYPMAEGAGPITYDAIGNINGTITSSSLTTFWETKQDIFAYNLTEGFGKISGSDAKFPLNSITKMYNSDFSSSVDGWSGYGAGYTLSYSNNILSSSRIDVDSTRDYNYIQHSYSGLTDLSKELKFHIKATIKNTSLTENLTGICIAIGRIDPRQITGLAYILLTGLAIAPNETYNLDTDLLQGTGIDTLNNIGIGVIFNAVATPTNALSFEISNIEITRNNYTEEHPKLEYGHNLAESTLDFTQGISGIAELNALTGIDNYTPATTVSGLYKRTITAGEKNYLLYKEPQTDTNLQRINNKETFYD